MNEASSLLQQEKQYIQPHELDELVTTPLSLAVANFWRVALAKYCTDKPNDVFPLDTPRSVDAWTFLEEWTMADHQS